MRSFTKIMPTMFEDKRWLSLDWAARGVFVYLLSGKHQTSAGAYKLPDLYAAADLGCDVSEFVTARKAVAAAGLILYDEETNELYIPGWFDENGITNDKHAMGTTRCISAINSDLIREAAEADYTVSYAAFYERQTKKPPGRQWGG